LISPWKTPSGQYATTDAATIGSAASTSGHKKASGSFMQNPPSLYASFTDDSYIVRLAFEIASIGAVHIECHRFGLSLAVAHKEQLKTYLRYSNLRAVEIVRADQPIDCVQNITTIRRFREPWFDVFDRWYIDLWHESNSAHSHCGNPIFVLNRKGKVRGK
jgi:hypothetical protein